MSTNVKNFLDSLIKIDPSLKQLERLPREGKSFRLTEEELQKEVERRVAAMRDSGDADRASVKELKAAQNQLAKAQREAEAQKKMIESALKAAQETIQEMNGVLTSLSEQASPIASVISVVEPVKARAAIPAKPASKSVTKEPDGGEVEVDIPAVEAQPAVEAKKGKCIILVGAAKLEVNYPEGEEFEGKIKPGTAVRIVAQTNQIIALVDEKKQPGDVQKVVKVIDDSSIEVEYPAGARAVIWSGPKPDEGDRVVLDLSGLVALRNIGPKETESVFKENTNVTWDDIGGLVEAKRMLREVLEEPYTHKDLYAKYKKKPSAGALLSGPPGCGKTLLGKACASSMAAIHGTSAAESGYIYVKGPEILNKWVGQSEGNIRTIFDNARRHKKKHGYPAIVFIDEADAVLSKRGGRDRGIEGMERTIVPMFLAEMDGLEDSGAFILIATNRPDVLDPAIVRDGRIDRKVRITRPDQESAEQIFRLHAKNRPLALDLDKFCSAAAKSVFDKSFTLYDVVLGDGKQHKFTLAHLLNGAMCAGIVEKATQLAIRREKAGDGDEGIELSDLVNAVVETFEEQKDLNHSDEIAEFGELKNQKVKTYARAQ